MPFEELVDIVEEKEKDYKKKRKTTKRNTKATKMLGNPGFCK